MSAWTDVTAVVRINSFRRRTPEDIEYVKNCFGKQLLFDSPDSVWLEHSRHPERFLPSGSEGSLKIFVETNPPQYIDAFTVTIVGALRDVWSGKPIISWFKDKMHHMPEDLLIRQAMITVDSDTDGIETWTYDGDEA